MTCGLHCSRHNLQIALKAFGCLRSGELRTLLRRPRLRQLVGEERGRPAASRRAPLRLDQVPGWKPDLVHAVPPLTGGLHCGAISWACAAFTMIAVPSLTGGAPLRLQPTVRIARQLGQVHLWPRPAVKRCPKAPACDA